MELIIKKFILTLITIVAITTNVIADELTDNDYAQQKDVGFKNVIFSLFYSYKILYNRKIKSKRNKKWINLGYC